jgi:hypothetical protein
VPIYVALKSLAASQGETYSGARNADGLRHGFGKACFSNGNSYEGQWENDHMQGAGESADHLYHRVCD